MTQKPKPLYRICQGYSQSELEELVELRLTNNWVCVGGVSVVAFDNGSITFFQAMQHKGI